MEDWPSVDPVTGLTVIGWGPFAQTSATTSAGKSAVPRHGCVARSVEWQVQMSHRSQKIGVRVGSVQSWDG